MAGREEGVDVDEGEEPRMSEDGGLLGLNATGGEARQTDRERLRPRVPWRFRELFFGTLACLIGSPERQGCAWV
jgi:hypothetical protein